MEENFPMEKVALGVVQAVRQEGGGSQVSVEIHSLWTEIPKENNRTISGGGWSLPRPQISYSQSQQTSPTRPAQKGSLEVQGE